MLPEPQAPPTEATVEPAPDNSPEIAAVPDDSSEIAVASETAPQIPSAPLTDESSQTSASPPIEAPQAPVAPATLPEAPRVAALPEAHLPEPPRPLLPGAFLRLEYEIKEVVARGLTNLYWADGGAYDESYPVLIAERDSRETWPETALESPLFPVGERFTQEGRDYLQFSSESGIALGDFNAPTNDETYLRLMSTLAQGLAELEAQKLRADFSRELLRIDVDGALRFFGFVEAGSQTMPSGLAQLAEISDFLLKRALSEAVTMRLDDAFAGLAMTEEVKDFARRLSENGFENAAEVAQAVRDLWAESALRVEAALLTDVGQERELNEDGGFIRRLHRAAHLGSYEFDIYAVSDGMGGHEGGEVASDLTLGALADALDARATELNWQDNVAVRSALLEIIDEVNRAVVELTESPAFRGKRAKPGATLTFAIRVGRRVFVANVGDSRGYKWSAETGLQRVTKDHSYVQMLIDAGDLTEEESWDHPDGSVITANIGDPKLRQKDVFLRLCKPGDKLLLVSDGVVDMLRDTEIAPFLHENDPREVVRDLVDASNTAGGADNITALCVIFL